MRAIRWADVVHYRYGTRGPAALPLDIDLRYLARANKPRLIDFCGTDIRIPEIASADNPYFAAAHQRGEIPPGSRSDSAARQALFARYGFACVLRRHEMAAYLRKELFPAHFMTASPISLSAFAPKYPDPAGGRPLVVHCPTRKGAKGTSAVLAAVETLKREEDFDFRLVHGVTREEALKIIRDSEIVVDQLVVGDYGNVTLEAMAFGKPAVCYIKPSVLARCPSDFPVVNANPENLAEILRRVIADGPMRSELGRKGRAYVEKYHDAHKVARHLVEIYQRLLEEAGGTGDNKRRGIRRLRANRQKRPASR